MRNRISVLRSFADALGRHRRILIKKLQRGTVSLEEMIAVADVLGVTFEQSFTLTNGYKIYLEN